jgi:hypothetical protein
MSLRFPGLILHFMEGLLGIANRFTDKFQRFCHELAFLIAPGTHEALIDASFAVQLLAEGLHR